jgi:NADH dehydrogenase
VTAPRIASVFGGTGFIGRYVVRELARAGYLVKVASRVPERAFFLKPAGTVGQIVPVACNYRDTVSIASVIRGSDLVINCVGILYEKKRGDFQRVHAGLPGMIAQACASTGVSRFVHLSALGVDRSASRYAKSKLEGERAVLSAFAAATILRPSVVFGPEDHFFNMFAGMARVLPALPLIGGGKTQFQPVYVGDVAAAVLAAAHQTGAAGSGSQGRVFELGGPAVMTFRQIYEMVFRYTGRRRMMVPLPFPVAMIDAAFLQYVPPRPVLTPDQVVSLKTDNVVTAGMPCLEDLGIRPTGVEQIVPAYLERFRSGGRFSDTKEA